MNVRTQGPQLDLPESVRRQFAGFARRLCLVETAFAVLGGACGLLAAYLVLFVSDRFWDTPSWLRALLAAGGTLSVAVFAALWAHRWVWRRRDDRHLAGMVQSRYPRLGDRLLGIVELADESKRPPNVSPALCRAAMQQVAADAVTLDFQRAVPTRNTRMSAATFSVCAGVLLVAFLLVPAAGLNALQRWLRPLASVPRYTLVQLEQLAPRQIVPYGELFEVHGRIKQTSRWFPTVARGRFDGQLPVEAAVEAGSFLFSVPGQTREGNFLLRVGDARHRVSIVPTFRPELTELRAGVEYPQYLGYPAAQLDARNGSAEILEGSRVTLAGRVSRPLRTATLGSQSLAAQRDQFSTAPMVVEETKRLAFEWQDELGLRGKAPFVMTINARKDQVPAVDCRGLPPVVAILEDEVLEFEVWAEDDFGVKQLGVSWEGEADKETEAEAPRGNAVVADGAPQLKKLAGKFRFAPQVMNLAPQLITLHATAADYYPEREPSRSVAYRIYVLDYARHAQLLQKEFERLLERLEEIARAEEAALESNERLHELSPEELAKPETAEKLREQERAENANAEQLRRLQEELMKLIKEALRNKTIPESVLREWAKLLETIQPLPSDLMPKVAGMLGKAGKETAQRLQRLAEALAQQKGVLERLMQALKQLNEANDLMQASNFVNRLRQAASAETEIGGTLQQMLPQSAGLSAEQLPTTLKTKLGTLHEKQSQTQKKVQYIRDDLGHFAKRSRQAKYDEVHEGMEKSHVVEELEKLADLVQDNQGAQAIDQTGKWATQLLAWADLLGKQSDGAGGQGAGQLSPEAIELMLKLMRIRQQEEGLRESTRFLEEQKAALPAYEESATRLARIQDGLGEQIQRIQRRYNLSQIAQLLDQVNAAMGDASQLLYKPQTDGETIAAETEVIELLSSACQGAGGGSSSSLMAALMQMLGMGAGATGGGSLQGGTTEHETTSANGSATGAPPEARHVEKAGGHSGSTLPAEFRDALEAYFDAVERMK
jgi:hypothetical protein